MIGTRYTRLVVVKNIKGSKWLCQCDCGNSLELYTSQLNSGNNASCGCLRKQLLITRNTTHGLSSRPEYGNWKEMLKRCFNKNNKRYNDYAGRGITVHEDFIKSFPKWLEEIGEKPSDGQRWSVGRTDNDASYTYGNIEWQLDGEQSRNHSMQSNNTSGITGVHLRTSIIAGKSYESFVACWNDIAGKKQTKNFSINKFGFEEAKKLAINYRQTKLDELKLLGIIYADSHGSRK